MNQRILLAVGGACALVMAASVVQAAPTIFFGENQTPGGIVSGAPLTARNSFLSLLSGVSSEGFETQTLGTTTPVNMTFTGSVGTLTATMTGAGDIANATTDVDAGRFNTTPGGSQWRRVSGDFEISFDTAVSAFGFYGVDIGDFLGQVTIELTDTSNKVTSLVVQNTIDGSNGSLLFWGFVDTGVSYKTISFGNTADGTDFFGFDDMVIGDREQIQVPEPASLALAGLALAGLAATRRRKA